MIRLPVKYLRVGALLWLALPMLIFLATWTTPVIGWPVGIALAAALFWPRRGVAARLAADAGCMVMTPRLWLAVALTAVLAVCSGVGGFFFQMEWDHSFRNEIFRQLVLNPWPVVNTELDTPRRLVYYIAFWLPAALAAKATGSMLVGNICQLLYAFVGMLIPILILLHCTGRRPLTCLAVFVLFSPWFMPLQAVLLLPEHSDFVLSPHFLCENNDLCTLFFGAPSVSILYFWIYNQGIAAWLGLTLLYTCRERVEAVGTVYCLLAFFSPIVAIGCLPPVAWLLLSSLRKSLSWQNVCGVAAALVVAAYFSGNRSRWRWTLEDNSPLEFAVMLALFLLVTYAVYMPWLWRSLRRDRLFWSLLVWSVLMSLIRIGEDYDFGWRVGIPCFCWLTYRMMRYVADCDWRLCRNRWLLVALLVGALSNFTYFRALRGEYRHLRYGTQRTSDGLSGKFWDPEQNPCYRNFVGE